jgi:hypothetical protein
LSHNDNCALGIKFNWDWYSSKPVEAFCKSCNCTSILFLESVFVYAIIRNYHSQVGQIFLFYSKTF